MELTFAEIGSIRMALREQRRSLEETIESRSKRDFDNEVFEVELVQVKKLLDKISSKYEEMYDNGIYTLNK